MHHGVAPPPTGCGVAAHHGAEGRCCSRSMAFQSLPTRGCPAGVHPKSSLLGFSAALAPKFHPDRREEEGACKQGSDLRRGEGTRGEPGSSRKGFSVDLEGGSGLSEGLCSRFRGRQWPERIYVIIRGGRARL